MKRYENLDKALCRELERLDRKYQGDVPEMDIKDVERADVLYHALKSAATYYAMKDSEEWGEEEKDGSGRSYARRRDGMGRYMSRGPGWDGGYSGGYSGHYPEWMPPYYPQRY